jgi:hypothetical protein
MKIKSQALYRGTQNDPNFVAKILKINIVPERLHRDSSGRESRNDTKKSYQYITVKKLFSKNRIIIEKKIIFLWGKFVLK